MAVVMVIATASAGDWLFFQATDKQSTVIKLLCFRSTHSHLTDLADKDPEKEGIPEVQKIVMAYFFLFLVSLTIK